MRKARLRKRDNRTATDSKGRSLRNPSSDSFKSPSPNSPHSTAWSAFSGQARWVSLALIAVNLIVYASVWHHDFVNYDDSVYVSKNADVSGGLTWHGVSWAFTAGVGANWHPLTWLSHMLDVQLYGLNPGPHHLTNLLFHIANTLLLFGLLHRMTGALGRSAFVAGLFAVHPLHVESVAWVAERKDVLSTLFWMLTLWAYVAYVRRPRLRRYLAVLLFFALGLMAKPMLVTLPFVLLLLDFWPLGRLSLRPNPAGHGAPFRDGWATAVHLVWEKLPLLALTVVSSIVTFVAQRREGSVIGLDAIPLNMRAGKRAGCVRRLHWQDAVADAIGGVISLCPVAIWMVGSGGVLGSDGHIRCSDTGGPAASLSTGGLVLVSGDTGSGDRVGSSGAPSNGRSLHLCSAHWFVHPCSVGCSGSAGPLAASEHCSPGRGGSRDFGVRDHCMGSASVLGK